ncbi:MAG: hypothetical protein PHE83_09435 [Opitutaceae bacterium]|nr:hypothetical protein [Opitutaceae bacterium]
MFSFNLGASVRYAVQVLDQAGRIVRRLPAKNNLILDSGLDLVATNYWANLFAQAVVGTGTTAVKRDSAAVTFSRSGTTVTASAGFFEAGDVGRLLKFDSGEEMYVITFTDSTHVEVDTSGTLAASEGTIWYVDQTGLTTETKRTGTFGTDSGDNGTSYAAGVFTMKRTFLFSTETGPITYNEVGWSYTASAGNNLFGRDIISGGVSLVAGQQLKIIVELSIDLSPKSSTAYTNVITGWSQNGAFGIESVPTDIYTMSYVDAAGSTVSPGIFDPAAAVALVTLSTMTDAISAITQTDLGLTGILKQNAAAGSSYITGSRERFFTANFALSEGNSTSIRSIGFHRNGNSRRSLRVLLDAAETKDSSHTLAITFRLGWNRVLTN